MRYGLPLIPTSLQASLNLFGNHAASFRCYCFSCRVAFWNYWVGPVASGTGRSNRRCARQGRCEETCGQGQNQTARVDRCRAMPNWRDCGYRHEFGVQQVGFTVFNNEYTPVPVNSWGLDDLIVSRVKAAATGGSVRKIPYAREDLARIKESRSLFRDENAEWKEFVQRSAGSSGCDRYVLVQGYGSQFSNTNQRVEGLGIVRWGNPFKSRVFLFALTFIRIYDGQTFELVARAAAAPEDEPIVSRLLLLKPIGGPHRELDEDSFPAVATEAASNPAYREGLRTLLTSSLDRTLPAMLRQ